MLELGALSCLPPRETFVPLWLDYSVRMIFTGKLLELTRSWKTFQRTGNKMWFSAQLPSLAKEIGLYLTSVKKKGLIKQYIFVSYQQTFTGSHISFLLKNNYAEKS